MTRRDGPAFPIVLPGCPIRTWGAESARFPETAPPAALADAAGGGPRGGRPGRPGGLRADGGIRHVAGAEKSALGHQGMGRPR
jgi:hypothetical protein